MDDRTWTERHKQKIQADEVRDARRRSQRLEDERLRAEREAILKADVAQLRGASNFNIAVQKTRERLVMMQREFELGEIISNNNLKRRAVEYRLSQQDREHETDEIDRLEGYRHSREKDFYTHKINEDMRQTTHNFDEDVRKTKSISSHNNRLEIQRKRAFEKIEQAMRNLSPSDVTQIADVISKLEELKDDEAGSEISLEADNDTPESSLEQFIEKG
ncbi:MAG: hypothetical protein AAF292_11110 [Pseudomonadota bacterium]